MTLLPMGPEAPTYHLQAPRRQVHHGRTVTLEPLSDRHASDLWQAAQSAEESWAYLGYGPFGSVDEFKQHLVKLQGLVDQPFFAVVPYGEGASGWLSYCDIDPRNATIEIGSVWFSPLLQRTRAATEALYLLLAHAFELGFNRVAWRCNALNMPSRRAAERLGFVFEGTWRKAQIIKGRWRDTSWYSQLTEDWRANKIEIERWLENSNFDENGQQRLPLQIVPRAALHYSPSDRSAAL